MALYPDEEERGLVETFPAGQGPQGAALQHSDPAIGEARPMPAGQPVNPALASTQPATVGATPAPNLADSQAGAGTPMDALADLDGESIVTMGEEAAERTGKASKANKKEVAQVTEKMGGEEAVQEAMQELADQVDTVISPGAGAAERASASKIDRGNPAKHETELKKRWKNIFHIIPKDDMGLFLMDFGMKMMAASQSNSFGGALGMAGGGALQGSLGRQSATEQAALTAEDTAYNRDLEADKLAKEAPDTFGSDQGVMEYKDGKWQTIAGPSGEAVMPSALTGRPSVKAWEMRAWGEAYPTWSNQKITTAALSGVTPQQALQDAKAAFKSSYDKGAVLIPDKGSVRKRNITDADEKAYTDKYVSDFYAEADNIGALPINTGVGGEPDFSSMTEDEIDQWMRDNQ